LGDRRRQRNLRLLTKLEILSFPPRRMTRRFRKVPFALFETTPATTREPRAPPTRGDHDHDFLFLLPTVSKYGLME
jgi:hypothetical protein